MNTAKSRMVILVSIVCIVALFGCATYTPKVNVPDSDADVSMWKVYYQDQIRASGMEIQAPSEDAPETQRLGYEEAMRAAKTASAVSTGALIVALVVGVGGLIGTLL